MSTSKDQSEQHTLQATLQEALDISNRIINLEAELRIAIAVAEHTRNRLVALSRDPEHDARPARFGDMMSAERRVLSIREQIGGLRMRLCVVQSRLEALQEERGGVE